MARHGSASKQHRSIRQPPARPGSSEPGRYSNNAERAKAKISLQILCNRQGLSNHRGWLRIILRLWINASLATRSDADCTLHRTAASMISSQRHSSPIRPRKLGAPGPGLPLAALFEAQNEVLELMARGTG